MNKAEVKLKIAAEEIKDILKKHDIAGTIALHAPGEIGKSGHGEFLTHLNTSYSCAYIYNDNEIRFYSKSADYKSREEQMEKQRNTANMLTVLCDLTAINFMGLSECTKKFDEITEAKNF